MKNIIGYLIPLILMLVIGILMLRSGEDLTRRWLPRFIVMAVAVFGSIRAITAQKNGKRKNLLNSHGELITKAFTGKGQRSLRRRFEKAVLLYDGNEYQKSRDGLLKLEPDCTHSVDHAAVYYMLGLVYTSMQNETEAIRFYRNSVAHISDNSVAWSNLGRLLSRSGQHQEAIECLNKAIGCDPENGTAHNNLATAYFRMGEYEKCIASAEKARELSPDLYQTANVLSCAYLHLGNEEKCAEYRTIAISLGSSEKALNEVHDNIRKMKEYNTVITPAGTTAD